MVKLHIFGFRGRLLLSGKDEACSGLADAKDSTGGKVDILLNIVENGLMFNDFRSSEGHRNVKN